MEHARFWSLIDGAGGDAAKLAEALTNCTAAEIVAFDAWFWAYYMVAQREDLWAAVYAIRGGCSDDSFDYFRGWLIGRGEAALLAAIRDPEALIEIIGEDNPRNELLLGTARKAYERVTGDDMPESSTVAPEIPGRALWPADRFPSGLKWNAAFYNERFPKLFAKYYAGRAPDPTGSIPEARFWAIIDEARGSTFELVLGALSDEELLGFDRWLSAYNQALMRGDMRAACRVMLGRDDVETVAGFRGWVIGEGEATVRIATHDLDGLAGRTAVANKGVIFSTERPMSKRSLYRSSEVEDEIIPDRATWAVDGPGDRALRERFPKLCAGYTDEQLAGPFDIARLTTYDRQKFAAEALDRARAIVDDAEKLAALDQAVTMWPTNEEARGMRGRVHARLDNLDAALADFDAALELRSDAALLQWERSKLRERRGDRAGALADARAVADRNPEARAWIAQQAPGIPKRVRHAKFGEGKVISSDTRGAEAKLTIEFASGRKTIAMRFVEPIEE